MKTAFARPIRARGKWAERGGADLWDSGALSLSTRAVRFGLVDLLISFEWTMGISRCVAAFFAQDQ